VTYPLRRAADAPRRRAGLLGVRRAAAAVLVAGLTCATAAAVRAQAPAAGPLRLIKTVHTGHGNAAHLRWSNDGKTVFLANEEGQMSAVKIDASDPAHPRIAAVSQAMNFLFGVDQRDGLLVYKSSVGGALARYDEGSLTPVWLRDKAGPGHVVVTDGSRIYFAREGNPGELDVFGADGSEGARVPAPSTWATVYGMTYEPSAKLVFVAGIENEPQQRQGSPEEPRGTVDIYDVSRTVPALVGTIQRATTDLAVSRGRLWLRGGTALETWDVSRPSQPRLLGSYDPPAEGRGDIRVLFGDMAVNGAGTRLYVAYRHGRYPPRCCAGAQAPAGVMIFDVTGPTPRLLAQNDWKIEREARVVPSAVALSPDGRTLAVAYWRFGVRFFGVTDDKLTDLGRVATTGEGHDVYVDQRGILYVFANDDLQIIDPETGRHLNDILLPDEGDGGWRPFRDGTIIVRSWGGGEVFLLRDGAVQMSERLRGVSTGIEDNVYDDPFLYSVGDNGDLIVRRVTASGDHEYTADVVGKTQVAPPEQRGQGGPILIAMAKSGSNIWALGPNEGVVQFDVSRPEDPRIVAQDRFVFHPNGLHAGLAVVRGRVYAGAGNQGVIIYDAATLRRTGHIDGLSADFLDTIGSDYLVVANYWRPKLPEGVYVYDLRGNPDAPSFVDRYPKPNGAPNFRVRVFGHRIYRVGLSGVDILQGP
jgi:hypothetical protein